MEQVKDIETLKGRVTARDPAPRSERAARVLIVSHYMPPHIGGIELVAESLFKAYGDFGFEVRWIASRAPRDADPVEGSRVRVACWNGLEERLGVPWPLWGWRGCRELSRLVEWADVIHVHDCLYLGSALALVFARRRHKKVLLSQHIGFVTYRSKVLNWLERLAYGIIGRRVLAGVSYLIYSTRAAEEFVVKLLAKRPENAEAIPNGIDTDRFRPPSEEERSVARGEMGLADSDSVVIFVGRLVEKKGVHILLEVCRLMPSVKFLVIGDGPLASELPLDSANLIWKPFFPPESMDRAYKAADLFLLPSHGEGFPLSVQEAMSAGLPVIVSRSEGFAEMLGREGACIPVERAAPAIKDVVSRLLDDPELGRDQAIRGRALVLREWSLPAMARRYAEKVLTLAGSVAAD
ncbi:MAG TPA: glycosyltransferase family 4 protein [Blastocatellia bacterium]|jgi:glycosyltransferase involved in cell wall biosynthesis|nr:glycosyltransferase family 4 protein [Blastocatellia bacterium]